MLAKKTVKVFRTIKLKEGLVESIEEFLESKEAYRLGLTTITDTIDYFTKTGIQKYLSKN